MELALKDGNVHYNQVDYINAHGQAHIIMINWKLWQ